MGNNVQELLDTLSTMINDAWGIPLGADKCVIEREKVLDILDEIKSELPQEIAEARRLLAAKEEFISSAKKEAESIRSSAEERAATLLDEQEIIKAAKAKSADIIAAAEARSSELNRVANEYADDTLKRTEEAIADALSEVRSSRSRFRSVLNTQPKSEPIVPDLDD